MYTLSFDHLVPQMSGKDLFYTLECIFREFSPCLHNHLRSFIVWFPDMILHSVNQFVPDTAI